MSCIFSLFVTFVYFFTKVYQYQQLNVWILCHCLTSEIITINVPVVSMARDLMVLRSATALRGALEGLGPENRDFFGP